MGLSFWHIVVVLVVTFLLFGSRFPKVMSDVAKGIRNFRDEMDKGKQEVLPPEDKDRA